MIRPRRAIVTAAVLAATLLIAAAGAMSGGSTALAQPKSDPGEIHGLKLGLKAAEMSEDTFGDLACGSNEQREAC